ncbi:glycosyl hydrolases family 31-domain-containing protein [Bipolaris maydis]|nr:glycoside hydrolase family 31 protein [Bipolaris maydis]KAJ5057741.1 glycosyl hydrolases family 31-domain-containing protein [Bipolaris maydis]KAJ6194993.1 glycosyl hydrolases family 31-domain-containing protein [Bipolaris maydis]
MVTKGLLALGSAIPALAGSLVPRQSTPLDDCPGYAVSNVQNDGSRVTADLTLAGTACNAYGEDLTDLKLEVEYQTEDRLHVKIYDAAEQVFQIQESVWPRPADDEGTDPEKSALTFTWTDSPFSFAIKRRATNETLFDTSAASLVFETQYLRLRTALPPLPNLYGLGESTDAFHLNTTNYTRTLWNRDAYGTPPGSNLYGAHPIYFDHRGENGTHGVFLASSEGMDIKIDDTDGQFLEYNTLGGVLDFYFLAGPGPKEVATQYSALSGLPAMMPYWGFGSHQCKYGYRDVWEVAEVVANYSAADIPLETMWTDIDYMELRRLFTLDPERYPLELVRQLVDYLHAHQQHYILMVNSAVWSGDYDAYNNGAKLEVFQKKSNGSFEQGAVWPGPTVFPDWFHPNTQKYWDEEFARFFDPATGVDIDGLWNDMNEPANFCPYPCSDPEAYSEESKNPPEPPAVRTSAGRQIPGFPAGFQPQSNSSTARRSVVKGPSSMRPSKRQAPNSAGDAKHLGLPGRDLINPKYQIHNEAGSISNRTLATDIKNYDGSYHYDTHNFWGSMMSITSHKSMQARRPERRPFIITRSSFPGLGSYLGKWLGDNVSEWAQYRFSIAGILNFNTIFQIPMVGPDICGFAGNTTETLCARWTTLGAFYPFMRNHAGDTSISQEYYRWPLTRAAAKNAIAVRYRLLDYFYTAFHRQATTGLPSLNPLFFHYPTDAKTFGIEHQFFYGDSILVSPVLEENSTSVSIYLPKDVFYDYWTGERIQGNGENINLTDVGFDTIPLHVKGGSILPLRAESANTTTELRKQNFVLWIAPNATNQASGSLYLDDGDSLEQKSTSLINFSFNNGAFSMSGDFGFETELVIQNITILGTSQSVQGPVALTKGWEHNFGAGAGMPQFDSGAAESRRVVAAVWGLVAGAVSVWFSL